RARKRRIGFRMPAQRFQSDAAPGVYGGLITAESSRAVEVGQRLAWLLQIEKEQAAIDEGVGQTGVALQAYSVLLERLLVLPELLQHAPAVVIAPGKLRPEVHASAEGAISQQVLAA